MRLKLIEDILDEFNFVKVKKTMDALEWKYFDSPDEFVNIGELRRMARNVLEDAYNYPNQEYYCGGCGGFECTRHMFAGDEKKYLNLKFVVTEWCDED